MRKRFVPLGHRWYITAVQTVSQRVQMRYSVIFECRLHDSVIVEILESSETSVGCALALRECYQGQDFFSLVISDHRQH